MQIKSYYKDLNTVYSYQFRNIVKKIPLGQINYHKKNFQYYLNLKIKNFRNKKILDTGAGSGIHSCILSLMGAHVFATDILQSNINKIKKFKKIYKFKNMEVFQHDFTKKLKSKKNFELISCHNWIQHTPKPSDTLYNIIQNLEVGGKIYVSCYHANTFRFYITQAARQILKISDFSLLKKRMKNIFKDGFLKYNNRDDIWHSNLTDDFFTPYLITTTYEDIIKLAKIYKLQIYTKIPRIKNLEVLDNIPLRIGLKKLKKVKKKNNNFFNKTINEFKIKKNKTINKITLKFKKTIKLIKRQKSTVKVDFCLGLYKIRAETSLVHNYSKFFLLNDYLDKYKKKINNLK